MLIRQSIQRKWKKKKQKRKNKLTLQRKVTNSQTPFFLLPLDVRSVNCNLRIDRLSLYSNGSEHVCCSLGKENASLLCDDNNFQSLWWGNLHLLSSGVGERRQRMCLQKLLTVSDQITYRNNSLDLLRSFCRTILIKCLICIIFFNLQKWLWYWQNCV